MAPDLEGRKIDSETIDRIVSALEDISYGSLNIIVQDSRIVQIDKVEKVRLDRSN